MAERDLSQASPDQLRDDIRDTRGRISHTLDALENRLSPQRIKQQATDTLREQTVGRAENLAEDAGRTVKGATSDVFETIKQNPLPAALAAIGLGWLIVESRREPDYSDRFEGDRSTGRERYRSAGQFADTGRYPGGSRYTSAGQYGYETGTSARDWQSGTSSQDWQSSPSAGDRMRETAGNIGDRASQTAGQVQDKAGQVAGQVQDKAGQMADQVQEQVGDWADTAQYQARQVRSRLGDLLDQNPLVVGAAALAFGAAIGLSLPATEKENRLLGPARDNLMDKAQDTAQQTLQKAQQVATKAASAATETAKSEAQKTNLTGSSMS